MSHFEKLFFIILILSVSYAAGDNTDKCLDKSFDVKNVVLDNPSGEFQNKISFLTAISLKQDITLPSVFTDKKDYQKQCLDKVTFNIYRTGSNVSYGEKEATVNGLVVFESLRYTEEYEVKSEYKQKNSIEKVESGSFKKTTCYGQPSPVQDLTATLQSDKTLLVNWKKPVSANAPNVCFYEVTVKELDQNKVIFTKKTSTTSMKIDAVDAIRPIEISIIAFNDQMFSGKLCYDKAVTSCRRQGSVSKETTYRPVTISPLTTTKGNDASVNRYQLLTFVSVIVSSFFSLL